MLLMIVPGIISVVFGLLFLFAPHVLTRRPPPSTPTPGRVETDRVFIQHRVATGICLLMAGGYCLSSASQVRTRLY